MTWLAGETITAARLNQDSDLTTLTQDSPAMVNTWEDWGSETVTFTDPGVPVKVKAWLNGRIFNITDSTSQGQIRVLISLDGGSTFDEGNTSGLTNQGTGAGNLQRMSAGAQHLLAGTPTGDVVIKAQLRADDTSNTFSNGVLMAEVVPQ
jgi:hypothetical protein